MRTSLPHRLRTAITEQIAQLDTRYYRLLLLAGAPGSGKTSLLRAYQEELSCPLINLNLALSHRLLEVKRGARATPAGSSRCSPTRRQILMAAGSSCSPSPP